MATRLILIRHGQTDWNLEKKYCGSMDIELNRRGRRQARCLRKRLKAEVIHKVYSSDRKRALETAKIIFRTKRPEKLADLREMHFGIFEGLTYKEIMKSHPAIYKRWLEDPSSVPIPEAEALNDFKKRVERAFKKIVCLNRNKTIAAICHGGTISIFISAILRKNDFWKQIPHTASLSIVEYRGSKPEIRLLDDTSHLDG